MEGTQLNNPKDPLARNEEAGRELFKMMGRVCNGFNQEAVVTAAANLLINSIRQQHKGRRHAEAHFDELTAKLKGILMDHYDPVTGNRRNIFPFTQNINIPFLGDVDKFRKT